MVQADCLEDLLGHASDFLTGSRLLFLLTFSSFCVLAFSLVEAGELAYPESRGLRGVHAGLIK